MTTLRSSPLRAMDKQEALRVLARDLNTSFAAMYVKFESDEEGGGGAPEWVPASAKIFIDLINDRAWTEEDGEVAVDTLLGSDPNTENGWDTTAYDPENLTSNGLLFDGSGSVALIGFARTKVFDSATVAITTKLGTFNTRAIFQMALVAANGNNAIQIDVDSQSNSGHATVLSWGGQLLAETDQAMVQSNDATNIFAFTITESRFEMALNGSTATEDALDDSDRPSDNPLVAFAFTVSPFTPINLQSIVIYDALASTTGLSALSV